MNVTLPILLILSLTSFIALGQSRPTYNPFNNGGMMNNGFQNNGFQNNYQRPYNNGFQNNGFQNNYQRPYNNGFQNNGFQRPNNNGFQNNGFQNNGLQNNNFQQPGNQGTIQTNSPQLFTRRFYLNNGYLYGRPTLWYDPKSGKMQPWVRKNLR